MTKEILGLPSWVPTPLHQRTLKAVQEIDQKLTNLVHKWRFLKAGPPMRVERYDGSEICYQGVAFSGSPVMVFWNGFIEPYLENYSLAVLEKTSSLALECHFSIDESIEEAKLLLIVMARRVYAEMAETDRILRGDGFNFPEKKDITGLAESMRHIISSHAEIEKMKKPTSNSPIINIGNLSGNGIQVGNNNQINHINIQQLVEEIAKSNDPQAKSMLRQLLENSTVASLVGAGASALLGLL